MAQYDDVLMELAANNNNKPSTSSSPLITSESNLTNAQGEQTFVPSYKPVKAKPVTAQEQTQQMFTTLSEQMAALGEEKDPDKKANSLIAFKGAAAEAFAKVAGQTRTLAETQAGVPMLMQQVKQAEMLDRQDPMYSRHMADSKETAMLRQRLASAQSRSDLLSRRMIAENPTVANMAAQVDSFIKLNDVLLQKDLARQDIQEQKVAEFMGAISPEAKNDIWAIRPDLKGNEAATVQFLTQEIKMNRKDWEPILSGTVKPEDLMLQGVTGNRVAAAIAIKKQVEATGLPEGMVIKQAKVLNDFVNNPAAADKIMKDFNLLANTKEQKAYQMLGLKGDKQGQLEQAKTRLSLVETLASRLAVGAISNNVDQWPVEPGKLGLMNLPEAGTIFSEFQKGAGRKPNIQEFHNAFVNVADIDPAERVRRSQIVQSAYSDMLKKASGGIYGTDIDVIGLTNKLAVKGVLKSMPTVQSWR